MRGDKDPRLPPFQPFLTSYLVLYGSSLPVVFRRALLVRLLAAGLLPTIEFVMVPPKGAH